MHDANAARAASMAMHPAGKGLLVDLIGPGVADTLDQLVAMAPVAMPAFDEAVYEVAADLAATLISKQADYGPKAINDAPGGAVNGVLVRAHDKLARLENLTRPAFSAPYNETPVNHEALLDSWLDLAGYALIGLLLATGRWPK